MVSPKAGIPSQERNRLSDKAHLAQTEPAVLVSDDNTNKLLNLWIKVSKQLLRHPWFPNYDGAQSFISKGKSLLET